MVIYRARYSIKGDFLRRITPCKKGADAPDELGEMYSTLVAENGSV